MRLRIVFDVGEEPTLLAHLKQSAPFHKYFPSGTGDLFAFDQTYVDHLDAVVDIIDGSFAIRLPLYHHLP